MHLWNDLLFIAPLFVPEPSAPVAAALGRKHCRISGLKFLPRENPEPQVREGKGKPVEIQKFFQYAICSHSISFLPRFSSPDSLCSQCIIYIISSFFTVPWGLPLPDPQATSNCSPSLILLKQLLQQVSPLDVCDLEGTGKILLNYTGQLVNRFPNASSPVYTHQGLTSPAVLVPEL